MPSVMLSDVGISYEDHGTGPSLLFIHGYPLHRQLWAGQWEKLSEIARVIVPDLRGHGESGAGNAPHTMEAFARDCFDLTEKLGISTPLIVCGLSMGGYIALAMLRMHPERMAGLILTATRSAADSTEAKANRDKAIQLAQTQGAKPVIDSMLPRLFSPKTFASRTEIVHYAHEIMSAISVDTIIKDLHGMRERPDSTALLAKSSQATLIIHGEDDQIVPLAEAQALQQTIPGAQLTVLPEAGHLLNLEQPHLFNAAIQQFIRNLANGKE
jgi:3-oxoadipate enol-lactonase